MRMGETGNASPSDDISLRGEVRVQGELWPANSRQVSAWDQQKVKSSQRDLHVQKCNNCPNEFCMLNVKSDCGIIAKFQQNS